MAEINRSRLFAASCVALLVTAMTFAFRAKIEQVFGPSGVGLTLEQIGYTFIPAFWGFTVAMVVGGPIVDFLGMRRGMQFAFVLHIIGAVATLMATEFWSLFWATVFIGLGNGMVEAVCNPLVASSYPDQKVKKLNHFHLWWPAGIVLGSILGYLVMDVAGLNWQVMIGLLFVPIAIYGWLFLGQDFPVTERVEMGVSHSDSFKSLFLPLYLFIGLCFMLSGATEHGMNQRISPLLVATGANPLLVLAFINGIMLVGRAFAGPISSRISVEGMLWFSAIFSFIGLWLLTTASGPFLFVAAAIFAVGITYFWPTTLSFISENIPQSGAFGLAIMGGLGMLAGGLVQPVLGYILDRFPGGDAIRFLSALPGILIVLYGALYFSRRKKGA